MCMIVAYFLVFARHYPKMANHTNLAVFCCLLIIVLYILKIFFNKRVSLDTITYCFRFSLITIYFIAGFHKLNSGFFALNGSCSTYISQGFNSFFLSKHINYPDYMVRFFQITTIVIEMIVPVGILYYKTRYYAVCILIIFHLYLSLCGFSNFSAVAVFLISACIIDLKATQLSKLPRLVKVYIFFVLVSVIVVCVLRHYNLSSRFEALVVNGIFLNCGIVLLFFNINKNSSPPVLTPKPILPFIIVMLICGWGLQGYLGLSNTANLTMFSNLVTEQSRSNHYLVNTAKTKIWNFEEDYITILKLPEQEKKWANKFKTVDYDLPVIEFKKQAAEWVRTSNQKLSCTLMYKNKIIEIDDLSNSSYSKPKWWYRFLYYRPIPKENINKCMW